MEQMSNKELIITALNTFVKRDGILNLISWLENSDFFTAPASTKYNLSVSGGLAQHAINRLNSLLALLLKIPITLPELLEEAADSDIDATYFNGIKDVTIESVILIGLLADVSKVRCYEKAIKNVKNEETQKWEAVEYWKWNEKFVYATRGTKTVFILQQFIKLFVEEAQAMAFISAGETLQFNNVLDTTYREIYESSFLAVYLHLAEMEACYVLDGVSETV
jgi:hypothetical protein